MQDGRPAHGGKNEGNHREEKVTQDVYPRIEYRSLCLTIKKIQFPQWDTVKISWKCGLVSETKMFFQKVGDHPYPPIEKKVIEHVTKVARFMKETFIVNGKPLIDACPNAQVRGIRKTQNTVLNLEILEPKPYEPAVPYVHGYRYRGVIDESRL